MNKDLEALLREADAWTAGRRHERVSDPVKVITGLAAALRAALADAERMRTFFMLAFNIAAAFESICEESGQREKHSGELGELMARYQAIDAARASAKEPQK